MSDTPDNPPVIPPEVDAVIARASRDLWDLPARERITLLRGIAKICPEGTEHHEVAIHLAHLTERLESEQLEFLRLFTK